MSIAAEVFVAFAVLLAACSAYSWWAAHDHPGGDQEGYMDTAVATALVAFLLLALGWAVA